MNDASVWVERIIAARKRWVAFLVVVTGLSVLGAVQVGVDNAVDIWFPDEDPALIAYHGFLDTFGNDEVVVIGVHGDGQSILTPAGLERVERVGEAATAVEGIAGVRSVVVEPVVRGTSGSLHVAPIAGPEEAQNLLQTDPLIQSLVSADGTTALVLAEMDNMGDIDTQRDGILAKLRAAVTTVDSTATFAGIGVVYAALNQASTQDAAAVIVGSYALILVLLRLFMGRWRPVFLTIGVVGLGAIWLVGLYGASGRDINMVTMVMPTLVLVIGVSDCVHMLTHVAKQPIELSPIERVRAGVGAVLWPCLFNTLTTSMGFLALATASMPVIQDLGVFCALGLVAAFLCSLVLCSIVAVLPGFLPVLRSSGRLQKTVDSMAHVAVSRPKPVLLVALLVSLISLFGASRIVVDTYSIDFLYPDHPVRINSAQIEADFGPYTPLEFVVSHPDGVRDPEILQSIADWQQAMESEPDVGWTRSVADVVQNLDQVLGQRTKGVVPTDPASVDQLLFVYEADADSDLPRFLDETDTRARVTVGVPMESARVFGATIERLTQLAKLPDGTTLEPAGYIPLYVRIMDHIVQSQISSFAWAFVVIFTLIGLLFRSVRVALISIPANLLPVLVTLGLMGLLGIRLDVATVTIAAIILGLVVDDTTQFLYRYRAIAKTVPDVPTAVHAAVRSVGLPMMITTLVLAGGFSVLGLASIKSVAYFGVLLAIALMSALLADLLVIPALLVVMARR